MRIGRKNKTQGRTIIQQNTISNPPDMEEENSYFLDVTNLRGMNYGDGKETFYRFIEDNQFAVCEGFYNRDNKLSSIPGPETLTPTKPNSNRILGLVSVNRFDGALDYLRFDKQKVHKLDSTSWVEITGGGLAGGDYDRFKVFFVEDRIFFNNNGANVLQEADLSTDTYADAGNARQYKYYEVINNRIVGAWLIDSTNDPTEVAGCGDRNYTEWDPTVDISAFRGSLIDTERDSADEITGLVNADGDLLVFRQRSIWLGTAQPIASAPFSFKKLPFGFGCNAPYSIRKVGKGVVWYDPFTRGVYLYRFIERDIVDIGQKVQKFIANNMGDPQYVFSSYDDFNDEYELGVEVGAFARIFRYNFELDSWTTQNVGSMCCISNSVNFLPSVTIDALLGTINDLVGTINGLSTSTLVAQKIYGTTTGDRVTPTNEASTYSIFLTSKTFHIPRRKQRIAYLEIDLSNETFNTIRIRVQCVDMDKGSLVVVSKDFVVQFLQKRFVTIKIPVGKVINNFKFNILPTGTSCVFGVLGFRIQRYDAGPL